MMFFASVFRWDYILQWLKNKFGLHREREEETKKLNLPKMEKNKEICNSEDIISNLPESLLHHILSYLDMKDVVNMSLVSRKWRYLWKSVPDLNLRIFWGSSKKRSVDFVDHVLLARDSDIHRLSLSCPEDIFGRLLDRWIAAAIDKCVHELNLNLVSAQLHKLPDFFFISTIRVFELDSIGTSVNIPIQLPTSVCSAPLLKTLRLRSTKFPEGDLNGELVLSCPVLENLVMKECDYRHLRLMNISAPKLKSLVMQSIDNYAEMNSGSCEIKVCGPKLTSLEYAGRLVNDFVVENLDSLVSAKVEMSCRSPARRRVKFLKGLNNAMTLELSLWQLEENKFSGSQAILNQLSETFRNLRCLRLTKWGDCSWTCVVANLLRSSPFIESLVLTDIEWYRSGTQEDWNEVFLSDCILYQLKYLKVKTSRGSTNELKLLEYLLKNARVLENLIIITTKGLSRDRELAEFCKKVNALPRAAPCIKLSFF